MSEHEEKIVAPCSQSSRPGQSEGHVDSQEGWSISSSIFLEEGKGPYLSHNSPSPFPHVPDKRKKEKEKASHFLGHLALRKPRAPWTKGSAQVHEDGKGQRCLLHFNRSSPKSIVTTIRKEKKKKKEEKRKKKKNGGLFFSVKVFVWFFLDFFFLLWLRHLSAWWLRWPRQWLLEFLV